MQITITFNHHHLSFNLYKQMSTMTVFDSTEQCFLLKLTEHSYKFHLS